MIASFADRETQALFEGRRIRRLPPEIQPVALRKLEMLHAAPDLASLRVPPGNRLEALKGDWKGWHSVRVNDRWRICFTWKDGHAHQVGIVDYH